MGAVPSPTTRRAKFTRKSLADGVEQLGGFPRNAPNIHLAGEALIDSGTRFDSRRIVRQLRGRKASAHALPRAHPDHQGSSRAVCDALRVPLWCGAGDADAVESGRLEGSMPDNLVSRISRRIIAGP